MAATALVLVLSGCSDGEPDDTGPPTTRQDFSRSLLTYDALPQGFFVTDDDTFLRTTGPAARQGLLGLIALPAGPIQPDDAPRCARTTPFADPEPVALVVTLNVSIGTVLVQAVGPPGVGLAALRATAAACPETSSDLITATTRLLPEPDVPADDALAVTVEYARQDQGSPESRRFTLTLAFATVGPVRVAVWARQFGGGEPEDPAIVSEALSSAVATARAATG